MLRTILSLVLGLGFLGCATKEKKFTEGQCYQPLFWPTDCSRIPRPEVYRHRI